MKAGSEKAKPKKGRPTLICDVTFAGSPASTGGGTVE